jgi:hypothetical protein
VSAGGAFLSTASQHVALQLQLATLTARCLLCCLPPPPQTRVGQHLTIHRRPETLFCDLQASRVLISTGTHQLLHRQQHLQQLAPRTTHSNQPTTHSSPCTTRSSHPTTLNSQRTWPHSPTTCQPHILCTSPSPWLHLAVPWPRPWHPH